MSLRSAALTPYFKNDAGRLEEDFRGFLRLTWNPGPQHSADRRGLLEQALVWLQQSGAGKVLADQRHMTPFSAEDQRWLNEDWTPRAAANGVYRHRALLTAHDVFARLASAAVITSMRNLVNYKYFDDEAAAVAWLLAQ